MGRDDGYVNAFFRPITPEEREEAKLLQERVNRAKREDEVKRARETVGEVLGGTIITPGHDPEVTNFPVPKKRKGIDPTAYTWDRGRE